MERVMKTVNLLDVSHKKAKQLFRGMLRRNRGLRRRCLGIRT